MSSKERVNVWISPVNAQMLAHITKQPGTTKAAIVDAALQAYFFPKKNEQVEQMVLHRLDNFGLRQGEIEKEVKVCVETLGQFVLYWLSMMDPMDSDDRLAAQSTGQRRFRHFITQVSEKLAADNGISATITNTLNGGADEVPPSKNDPQTTLVAAE